jgi:hypothetical protein
MLVPPQTGAGVAPAAQAPAGRRLLSEGALLARLDALGNIAPAAPLSFLIVRVLNGGLAPAGSSLAARHGRMVEERLAGLLRPTDIAGRMEGGTFGVVLQGAGPARASATAAKLRHGLRGLRTASGPVLAEVTAASGMGANGRTLAAAASEPLDDCC